MIDDSLSGAFEENDAMNLCSMDKYISKIAINMFEVIGQPF
jgi:hypothetical protein